MNARKRLSRPATLRLLTLSIILIFLGSAWAQHLRSFSFNGENGYSPQGGLVVDNAGNFYGGTQGGGDFNGGVVFEINLTSETTLYNFTGTNGDGLGANGDLIFDDAGNLYGTTVSGGSCSTNDCGTVFELSPPTLPGDAWTETVLHSFAGFPDGSRPAAGLVFDATGNLYGTTANGGSSSCGCGTVFELTPPSQPGGMWTETILYSFQGGPDGTRPISQLIFDQAGNLYGTTYLGGGNGGGTVFELTPPPMPGMAWTKSVLHRFVSASGICPEAGLTWGPSGTLFGTTSQGGSNRGGTVFRLAPSDQGEWTYNNIYSFTEAAGSPAAPVRLNDVNTLYGTTANYVENSGSVFQISYAGDIVSESVLYSPGPSTGGVLLYGDALYATTQSGASGDGTVYRLSH